MSKRTSKYLQRCLDHPEGSELPESIRLRIERPSWVWDWLGNALVSQYEDVHSDSGRFQSDEPGGLEEVLDDALCRKFIKEVPEVVVRLAAFERLEVDNEPTDSVRAFFQEAVRCYVLGLSAASVALARSCLEQALKETVPLDQAEMRSLDTLIAEALPTKALDAPHQAWCRDIQRIGNRVLHRDVCTVQQSHEVILKLRSVLKMLYGSRD
jgi:hypothetical protein